MKSTIRALTLATAALLFGCQEQELDEMFSEIEDAAPSVCRSFCEADTVCSWDSGSIDGPEALHAYEDAIEACIIDCAYVCATGVYVAEYEDNGDIRLKRELDGSTYQAYIECLWDAPQVYDCSEFGLEMANDDDACDAFDDCAHILGIDIDYDWNSEANYCEVKGDEFLFY